MKHPTRDTLALVESPAQFLHVLEWCHAERTADRTSLVVLAPSDAMAVAQLRSMGDFAEEEGIPVSWCAPRASAGAGLHALVEFRGPVARARRLVIGDPFSGMIQALLTSARAGEVVVVDDGTATLEFATQLAHGEPLRRWHAGLGAARAPLAFLARAYLERSRLRLFTVMTLATVPGSQVVPNSYDWTRRRFGPPRVLPGVDVIGSSLVETGVVEPDAYLDAVVALAEHSGAAGRYFAHRREDPAKLNGIARISGLRIVRPRVPLEIELRRGPVAAQLASFPSSVAYTLPVVLAGVGARIDVQPLPDSMIREQVGARARGFLARISQDLQASAAGGPAVVSASA